MEYKLQIKKIKLNKNKRIICISDIHGGLHLLKELLEKVNYTKDDYLFIIGDIIEKGPYSLRTLQYVMELSKNENVFILIGNNDFVLIDILNDDYSFEYLKYLKKTNSIYHDFEKYFNLKIETHEDILKINKLIRQEFSSEINFILNLPTIIETDKLLFAHASITDYNNLENLDYHEVLKYDYFMRKDFFLPKRLIVGHYPSVAYCTNHCNLRPISNHDKNIVSIDGGYTAKIGGQLNCYIIRNENTLEESYSYVDDLPKAIALVDDPGKSPTVIAIWDREEFEALKKGEYSSICKINDKIIEIPNDFVYFQKNKYYCADYTNEILPLSKDEIIKIVIEYDNMYFCKKDDVLGFVSKDNLHKIKTDD